MDGQEARDDEREALIERAREVSGALEEYEFEGAAGEAAGLLNSLADALARKHPEPEITEAQAGAILDAIETFDPWPTRERLIERVRAALREPVGEGEQ